jgi:hypothetical protein
MQSAEIPTAQALLVQCLGLSLTDHYWICPADRDYSWDALNLFTNQFHDPIGRAQFQKVISADCFAEDFIRSPAASLQGDLPKRWVIGPESRYLIKGNRGTTSQQSLNEVFASMLHKKQGFHNYTDYAVYPLKAETGKQLGCICKGFTSAKLEFIPAIDIVGSKKRNNATSQYEHFIAVCAEHGLPDAEVRAFLEYEITTDFLLTNTDRHMNNFGVLRDSDSLQFVAMAPIFDSGNSMFWDVPSLPLHDSLENISVNSFRSKENDVLRLVKNPGCANLFKLPTDDELEHLYSQDPAIPVDAILAGYHRKIELLAAMQAAYRP